MASKFKFRSIIGIDFAEYPIQVCEKNIENIRKKSNKDLKISCECADATEYKLPNEGLFIFMANPFNHVMMEKFVELLEKRFLENRQTMYIAYYHHKHGDILENAWFLQSVPVKPAMLYVSVFPIWPAAMFRTID